MRIGRRLTGAVLGLALAGVVLAGCGDDDDTTDDSVDTTGESVDGDNGDDGAGGADDGSGGDDGAGESGGDVDGGGMGDAGPGGDIPFNEESQTVPAADVAQQAKTSLEDEVGAQADSVECEEDLVAEVGQSVRCQLTAGGDTIGLTASVSSVDGDRVHMNFQVDQ